MRLYLVEVRSLFCLTCNLPVCWDFPTNHHWASSPPQLRHLYVYYALSLWTSCGRLQPIQIGSLCDHYGFLPSPSTPSQFGDSWCLWTLPPTVRHTTRTKWPIQHPLPSAGLIYKSGSFEVLVSAEKWMEAWQLDTSWSGLERSQSQGEVGGIGRRNRY